MAKHSPCKRGKAGSIPAAGTMGLELEDTAPQDKLTFETTEEEELWLLVIEMNCHLESYEAIDRADDIIRAYKNRMRG